MINLDHHILSHPGKRRLNEDSVFPQHVNGAVASTFLICDGVGGSNKGDIASSIVSREIGHLLNNRTDLTFEDIRSYIQRAEIKLSDHSTAFPECQGMATTLVGFHPTSPSSAIVFWVGDSRLYQVRNGEVLFKTRDHSLVQLMIENGQLTEEQAHKSKRKNIILQAVCDGNKECAPEFREIKKIQPGDQFLLLSDGILEGCPETELLSTLQSFPLKDAFREIRRTCENHSSDNFSLIALEVV